MHTHTTHHIECTYVSKFLSCIHTLLLKELTGMRTHISPHGFPPLASHHNHVIHLTHTCTPTRSDTFGFVSLWVSHNAWLSVWMKSVFSQHSCDHALHIFLFLLLRLFYLHVLKLVYLSPALPLSSMCLNPGLANNKEQLWLKLAIHQILFLSSVFVGIKGFTLLLFLSTLSFSNSLCQFIL